MVINRFEIKKADLSLVAFPDLRVRFHLVAFFKQFSFEACLMDIVYWLSTGQPLLPNYPPEIDLAKKPQNSSRIAFRISRTV